MIDRTVGPAEPLIPPGGRFSGLVDVVGTARIDGTVEGDVFVTEALWIGVEARVCGRIEARAVVVEGGVEGEIRAAEKIDLRATARVRATLHTACFVLADGGVFEGRCHTVPIERAREPRDSGRTEFEAPNPLKLRPSM